MTHTAASLVRQLAAELHALDQRRVQVLHAMHALGQLMGTTARLTVPVAAKGHRRTLRAELYEQTLRLLRASHAALSIRDIRQQLQARQLPVTSVYAHVMRAVSRGDLVRAGRNRYRAVTTAELAKRTHDAQIMADAKAAAKAAKAAVKADNVRKVEEGARHGRPE